MIFSALNIPGTLIDWILMNGKKGSDIQQMFSLIPKTYEKVNHIITLGFDMLLRKRLSAAAGNAKKGNWADMCTGTGETAVNLKRIAPRGTKIFAVDFSSEMIETAKGKPEAADITFINSDIKNLPFPDNHLYLITMSFATRNINLNRETLVKSFSEYYRVLKPGGIFINLETSRPRSRFVRFCFDIYIKAVVKLAGFLISGQKSPYEYLSKSIRSFYPPEELSGIIRTAGFQEVSFRRYMAGGTAVHQAVK